MALKIQDGYEVTKLSLKNKLAEPTNGKEERKYLDALQKEVDKIYLENKEEDEQNMTPDQIEKQVKDLAEFLGAESLKEHQALTIEAYVTHPVLSGNAKEKIMLSPIDNIFVSDSIYHASLPDKFAICT